MAHPLPHLRFCAHALSTVLSILYQRLWGHGLSMLIPCMGFFPKLEVYLPV